MGSLWQLHCRALRPGGGGVAAWRGYDYWQTRQSEAAGAAFEAAVTLGVDGKHKEASEAFAKIAATGTAGYRVLARMREAAELAPTDSKAAVKAYDDMAADRSVGEVMQDLAAVRAGLLLVDTVPYAELQGRLEPQAGDGRPFRQHGARSAGVGGVESRQRCRCEALVRCDHGRSDVAGGAAQSRRSAERVACGQRQRLSGDDMRRSARLAGLCAALALALLVGACAKNGNGIDPTDLFASDMDTRKS